MEGVAVSLCIIGLGIQILNEIKSLKEIKNSNQNL